MRGGRFVIARGRRELEASGEACKGLGSEWKFSPDRVVHLHSV